MNLPIASAVSANNPVTPEQVTEVMAKTCPVEAYRGKLYLAGMQESIRLIFETSRLKQVFRIRRDVAEALKN